ncbi:RNase adapter RapZ [Finegoldia sp. BIOML-A2]|uniref:RNase adapter RapZ n=1 Tax=Finegoldia TaxID=150022 RepID=UPI000B918F7D|nr:MULTISPECIES: RNase adapter RapZ [Finegoldia]MCC2716793.1 RNase adapter RapZ [Finegoldia magna]MDU2500380.1 RNase adapter RapZ [Finegoldia magna]MDU5223638.1 RNase adapter RapZ [Finegoldia magna]MDU5236469.1 RNase adapter RapZ [Finegoldia magna]MSA96922.1 RNase adapter RapZ [Finegoldia sp. BIOML-A5]
MEVVIITGMSGAGKSASSDIFEDLGYYTLDNMPPSLLLSFIDLTTKSKKKINKIACVVDIRGGEFFADLMKSITLLKNQSIDVKILYLDASDEILIRRYKEHRRPHPLAVNGNISEGIANERELLSEVRNSADSIINTSNLTLGELRRKILSAFSLKDVDTKLAISVVSFGFKHGILLDADLIFDVRFLPNPYYIEELKKSSGLNTDIKEYVFGFEEANEFLDKLVDMMEFLIPKYSKEGKTNLVIGIGCTGGKHRSVAIAQALTTRLEGNGEKVYVSHRDQKFW